MYDFTNKVVMVTGGAGNLGAAVARAFLASGAKLVLTDNSQSRDRLARVFPEMATSSEHCLVHSTDLTDPASVDTAVEKVVEHFGRIDVLVNTVGGFRSGTALHETPLETWDFMHNINARTVFIVSRAVIPVMLSAGYGKILNIAARPGLAGRANMAAYSASKSAVLRLTESMAAELRRSGINVNCILPGTIDTPQNRNAMPDANPERWVKPESLAQVILFLCSDYARDVHGAALPVYGES